MPACARRPCRRDAAASERSRANAPHGRARPDGLLLRRSDVVVGLVGAGGVEGGRAGWRRADGVLGEVDGAVGVVDYAELDDGRGVDRAAVGWERRESLA